MIRGKTKNPDKVWLMFKRSVILVTVEAYYSLPWRAFNCFLKKCYWQNCSLLHQQFWIKMSVCEKKIGDSSKQIWFCNWKTNLIVIGWDLQGSVAQKLKNSKPLLLCCYLLFFVDSPWLFAEDRQIRSVFCCDQKRRQDLIVVTLLGEDVSLEVPAYAHFSSKHVR